MRNRKNTAAILGGVAALIVFAVGAISAYAFESVPMEEREAELTAGRINIVADEVYAEAGETVSFNIMIVNNTGYAGCGVALNYDSALTPILDQSGNADLTVGPGTEGLLTHDDINLEKCLVGMSIMGDTNCTEDGAMFTVQFTVPADAPVNTVYPMKTIVSSVLNAQTNPIAYAVVDGWIRVRPAQTTTTVTTVTTATTATTTTTTAETTLATSTTVSATTVTSTVDTTTTSITTFFGTDISTSISTKKTDRDPTAEVTTSRHAGNNGGNNGNHQNNGNAGSNTKAESVRTGDPGIGTAIAAFLLAGVSAVMFGRKKKD